MPLPTFPPLAGLAYPVRRRPIMSAAVMRSVNNKVTALQMSSFPTWNYELPYSFLRALSPSEEFQTLVAFFLECRGQARLFQFNDVDDNTAVAQPLGLGDGVTREFQLVRAITGSTFSFVEPVFAPLVISEVTQDGVPTVDYVTPGSTGIIRFITAPADGVALAWSGTYNWLCRFDEGSAEFEKFADKFWRLGKISFTTEAV